jgi:hypothetical protein
MHVCICILEHRYLPSYRALHPAAIILRKQKNVVCPRRHIAGSSTWQLVPRSRTSMYGVLFITGVWDGHGHGLPSLGRFVSASGKSQNFRAREHEQAESTHPGRTVHRIRSYPSHIQRGGLKYQVSRSRWPASHRTCLYQADPFQYKSCISAPFTKLARVDAPASTLT